MTLKNDAVRGISWTGTAAIFNIGIQIVQLVVLARLLSPEDFGLMGILMLIIGFAQSFSDLGISAAIVAKQDISDNTLSSLYWLNVLFGIVLYIIIYFSIPIILHFFNEAKLIQLIPIGSLLFILGSGGVQFQMLLQKELLFSILSRIDMLSALVGALVTIAAAFYALGVWSLVYGQLSGALIRLLLLLYIAFLEKWLPKCHFSYEEVKPFLSFGLYQMGERCINYFNSKSDQMLIGSILGTSTLGLYNFANNLVFQPSLRIFPVIINVMFPIFAKIQHDTKKMQNAYIKLLKILVALHSPIMVFMCILSPVIIPYVFGDKWNDSIYIVQVLSIYVLIRSTGSPVGSIQLAKGRADLGFKWNLMLFFITNPALYLTARIYGLNGIVWTLCGLMIIYGVASYFYMIRTLIGKCGKEYSLAILKPILISCIMGLGIYTAAFLSISGCLLILVQLFIGIVLYYYGIKKLIPELYSEVASVFLERRLNLFAWRK